MRQTIVGFSKKSESEGDATPGDVTLSFLTPREPENPTENPPRYLACSNTLVDCCEDPKGIDVSKSAKDDDARIPIEVWDDRIWSAAIHCPARLTRFLNQYAESPLTILRIMFLRLWRRRILREGLAYLRHTAGPSKSVLEGVRECIQKATQADWWEWLGGSRIFFWRWPAAHQEAMRCGHPVFVKFDLPRYRRPQPAERDKLTRDRVTAKLVNVRNKQYIKPGKVTSLTGYFAVPKGTADVRLVYDASRSGLNRALWAPNFGLPTVESHLRGVTFGSWMGDIDLGEMFLNFCLDESLHEYCGVDLGPYLNTKLTRTRWERWVRCMMGLKASPYLAAKGMLLALEWILGDTMDPSNVFHWDRVRLNLPGHPTYDPQLPWVSRVKTVGSEEVLAAMLVAYVDDLRAAGMSESNCWKVMHHISSRLGYLGLQFAARKTRPPSQNPGPWAGSVVMASATEVGVCCTQEKWDKAKAFITDLLLAVQAGGGLDRKNLEKIRGFLVHVQQTYPALTPYLKGLHLTIDSWRPGRDEEGWKSQGSGSQGFWDDELQLWIELGEDLTEAPALVRAVPRLEGDLKALALLLAATTPPLRRVRAKSIMSASYGFGDASGSGLGSSTISGTTLSVTQGVWSRREANESSNFRELANLIRTLEEGLATGQLLNTEFFLFTDNTTAESVYYNGTSKSKRLFDLALKLRLLEMKGDFQFHFIHVAGSRMIAQGTDGLSRGSLSEGIMQGISMLNYIPLHQTAAARQPALISWIQGWSEQPRLTPLLPEDWYRRGQGFVGVTLSSGQWSTVETGEDWFLWAPPPAAADAALEALNESRIKRSHLNHIFICPRLMTHRWRKRLHKLADIVFEVPPRCPEFWPTHEHEPLVVGLILRFSNCSPWQVKQSPLLLGVARQLQEMWEGEDRHQWPLLRQLCKLPGLLEGM